MPSANRVALDVAEQTCKDMTIRAPEPSTCRSRPARRATVDLRRHPPDGLRGPDPQGRRGRLRAGHRGPAAPLGQRPRAVHRRRRGRADGPGRRALAPARSFDGKVSADQPGGRPGQPHLPGRGHGPQRRGLAPPRRVRQGDDRHPARTTRRSSCRPSRSYRFAGVTKVFLVEGEARDRRGRPGWLDRGLGTGSRRSRSRSIARTPLPRVRPVVTTGQTQLADGTASSIRTPVRPPEPKADRKTIK